MKGISNTSSQAFRELMGNGLIYEIPKFQRDYSWNTEQWDDLWQDIISLKDGEESEHYMGYLVIQSNDNKNFQVIDGQQRLTTLSILILTVLKCIQDLINKKEEVKDNEQRIASLRNSYIGYIDPVTLVPRNKLKLNRNNDDYYRNYIISLSDLPNRKINLSERLMRNCFEWFYDKLKNQYSTGEEFAKFVEIVAEKLFFTEIKVSDELNAFKVFETLNARGVQLSSSDLLKNYLFSVVDSSKPHINEINEIESFWTKILNNLGNEKFQEFLRFYWNSKNKTVRKNDLFKAIRKNIKNKNEVFDLIRDLDRYSNIYIALQNPEDETWKESREIQKHLKELKIFGVKQPYSLLLSAYFNLKEEEFLKVLKSSSIVSFRYNTIGGLNPNEQETTYNSIALSILNNKKFNKTDFKDVYPNDENFETDFSNVSFKNTSRNNKIIKYILTKTERYEYQTDLDLNSDLYTIEHILPENILDWDNLTEDEIERCIYRLGNLTLLEASLNKEAAQKSYEEKKEIFKKSKVNITNQIPIDYNHWNEESISKRQRKLAKNAKSIWSIQF